jgi:hypothetical protein
MAPRAKGPDGVCEHVSRTLEFTAGSERTSEHSERVSEPTSKGMSSRDNYGRDFRLFFELSDASAFAVARKVIDR